LQRNLSLNRAGNVRAVNVAAGESRGKQRLYAGDDYNIGLSSTVEKEGLRFEAEVLAAPLSDIVTGAESRSARLIKIDVEGAEAAVVRGMTTILEAARPDLEVMVEINPELLAAQGRRPEDVTDVFDSAGFQGYALDNNYSALSYLEPADDHGPIRIPGAIEWDTDVIFSRADRRQL
jgi:FkbM family methyltransferase